MTNEQLNEAGFIVSEREIQPMDYREYLNEYGKDETTTPNGIGDRMHMREVDHDFYKVDGFEQVFETHEEASFFATENDLTDDDINITGSHWSEWQVWTWGVGGNNPRYTGTSFDNEEDAELYYYERSELYISEKNWDAPVWHDTYEDAVAEIAERFCKPIAVIERYLSIAEVTKRKDAEHRAKMTAEYEKRKAWLAIEVPKEADSLLIDEDFKAAIKWASEAKGNEKSSRMASALKGLLTRNNKSEIKTDFWQVLRILKSKCN